MKKLLIMAVALFSISMVHAQGDKYIGFMKTNLAMLDSAKTPDDFQAVANSFERIANAEKEQWQPYYHAAYSLVMKSFISQDKSGVDANCDKADQLISMAESLKQNNSDITTLKAMVLQARMGVDQSRGMTMGPRSSQLLQQALQQEPANNPRPLVQMAQNKYYTPAAFGGSKEGGIEMLKKALENFATFKPAGEFDPNWGKDWAEGLLKNWTAK